MRVILLMGSSSAGKSTLCRGVVEQTDPKWIIRDTDTYAKSCIHQALDIFSKNYSIQGLLSELEMSPDQIVDFVWKGKLQIGKPANFTPHQFQDLELTGLEQILQRANIKDDRIPFLAEELRNLTKHREQLMALMPQPTPEFLNDFFKSVFSEKFNSDDTLVIDVNPHPAVGPAVVSALIDQHIEEYGTTQDQAIESFKVLAYCPIEELSRRMHQRSQNKKADDYMGEGIFPFQQVSMLVSPLRTEEKNEAAQINSQTSIGELTRKSVFDVANKHTKTNHEAVVIVDAADPSLQASEEGSLDSSDSEIPAVAPKSVVQAYHDLTDKFGFYPNETHIKLGVAKDYQCDIVIDTSKQDAKDLVEEINQLTAARTLRFN